MLMLFVLSYKTGDVVNSGTWLAKLPPRAQQSQDSPLFYLGLQGLRSQRAVRTLTVRAVSRQVRSEVRDLLCLQSLNKTI